MTNLQKEIKFHKEWEASGWFNNFYGAAEGLQKKIKASIPSQLTEKGEPTSGSVDLITEAEWPTSEHLFQALKFSEAGRQSEMRHILTITKPLDTKTFANGRERKSRQDWHTGSVPYKLRAMRYTVRKKFSQDADLKKKLLDTSDATLIEDTASSIGNRDPYWGNAPNNNGGPGDNWLGKILMEIRAELQTKEKSKKNGGSVPNKPKTPTGTRDTNINDNEEVKFLQHILYHRAELDKTKIDKKYNNFPNDIFDSYKSSKFSDLEDYRIETIKEILKKVDPKKVNELKKQILAEFEKNNLISKIKEKELKKILEIEEGNNKDEVPNSDEPAKDGNRPTNNKSDKSNKPTNNDKPNNNKNDNSPSQKPVINSPINVEKISNSATVSEARRQAKTQIIKLFQANGIKPGDLKNFWKGHENWESHLTTLTTSQEIAQFSDKLQKAIIEKKKGANDNKKTNLQLTKSNWKKFCPWIIGGTLIVVGVFFLYLFKKRIKKN